MGRQSGAFALLFFLSSAVLAEIYVPPPNIRDPLRKSKAVGNESDKSLPFVYLEPYQGCFSHRTAIRVTLWVVNRSDKPVVVRWKEYFQSLAIEALGSEGRVVPLRDPPRGGVTEIKSFAWSATEVDLRDYFEFHGSSVCRLIFARPLDDGRIHVGNTVQFVVEDFAAIDRLAKKAFADNQSLRKKALALLKANPFFADGALKKSYGWDLERWEEGSRFLQEEAWTKSLKEAWKVARDACADDAHSDETWQLLELLVERLFHLSGELDCPAAAVDFFQTFLRAERAPEESRSKLCRRLASSKNFFLAREALYGMPDGPEKIDLLIRVADGSNRALAERALSMLSNYRPSGKISLFLRRKMTDPDPEVALHAAIITCYAGDWSGFPVLLKAASHENEKLRETAVAQLGADPFQRHPKEVIPVLVRQLRAEKNLVILSRILESLDDYATPKVAEAVRPFLKHADERVRQRARTTLDRIEKDLKQKQPP